MNCERLREVLVEHVDGLLGAAEAEGARSHLAACADCRRLQEEVRRNFAALDAWADEDLPAGAWERLAARLPAGPTARIAPPLAPPPAPRPFLRVAVPYALGLATAAAAVLIVVQPWAGAQAPRPSPLAPDATTPEGPAPLALRNVPNSLKPGEKRLVFADPVRGVTGEIRLPPGVSPDQVYPDPAEPSAPEVELVGAMK